MFNKGLWSSYGQKYYKTTNKGFTGFGVNAFLKERNENGFELIENQTELEKKIFKHVETTLDSEPGDRQSSLFSFFECQVDPETIFKKRAEFIDLVKQVSNFNSQGLKELVQLDCVLMKAFYQAKGTLVMTAEELIFVFVDDPPVEEKGLQDNLFFFHKQKHNKKLFKKIELEGIREIQKRKFIGQKFSLELFMIDNSSYLLRFESSDSRDSFAKKLLKQRGLKC